jgi:hypothetical protein
MSLSHRLRTREFLGEFEAGRLILWLAENEYEPRKRRIMVSDEPTSEFKRVHKVLALAQQALSLGRSSHSTEASKRRDRVRLLQQMDLHLRRYNFQLRVRDSLGPNWTERNMPPIDPSEAQAIVHLLNLAELGLIDRIRQCGWCTTWFYARFNHQRFCKTECQQAEYAKTPASKARRRDYMRKYRSDQKRRT